MGSRPMGSIEHLTRLKNHLDDVFVAVGLRGFDRIGRKNE